MSLKLLPTLLLTLAFADPRSASKTKPIKETSLTGCLDQRQETYVLTSGADMSTLTTLKGKSFSDDNFARYVGQKVKVSGSVEANTMQVRRIDKVADTCSDAKANTPISR